MKQPMPIQFVSNAWPGWETYKYRATFYMESFQFSSSVLEMEDDGPHDTICTATLWFNSYRVLGDICMLGDWSTAMKVYLTTNRFVRKEARL